MHSLINILGLLRSLMITVPLVYGWTIVMGIISLVIAPFDPDSHRQHNCSRIWSRGLLWLSGVNTKVYGKEKVDFSRPYVFLANHQSYMDIPTLYAHLPVTFRIMAKASLFHIPFLGWHLARTGNMPIGRGGKTGDARALLGAMRSIKGGRPMMVFPEGARNKHGNIQEFKPGIFLAAIKTGAPIVPLTVLGTRHVLPAHSWHLRPGKVQLHIGEPIITEGMTKADLESVMSRVRDEMESHFAE